MKNYNRYENNYNLANLNPNNQKRMPSTTPSNRFYSNPMSIFNPKWISTTTAPYIWSFTTSANKWSPTTTNAYRWSSKYSPNTWSSTKASSNKLSSIIIAQEPFNKNQNEWTTTTTKNDHQYDDQKDENLLYNIDYKKPKSENNKPNEWSTATNSGQKVKVDQKYENLLYNIDYKKPQPDIASNKLKTSSGDDNTDDTTDNSIDDIEKISKFSNMTVSNKNNNAHKLATPTSNDQKIIVDHEDEKIFDRIDDKKTQPNINTSKSKTDSDYNTDEEIDQTSTGIIF